MSRTRPNRARRAKAADGRTARRASLLVLLARVQRGVLTATEANLMRAHVEVELDEADALRATVAGQQNAMRRQEARLAAAMEPAAVTHHVTTGRDATAATEAERHRRTLAAILAKPTGTPFNELTEYTAQRLTRAGERILAVEKRANTAEATIERMQRTNRMVNGGAREERTRAERAEATLARIRAATQWADVWAAIGMHDGLSAQEAGIRTRVMRLADSTAAQLAEQRRAHEIAQAQARKQLDQVAAELAALRGKSCECSPNCP